MFKDGSSALVHYLSIGDHDTTRFTLSVVLLQFRKNNKSCWFHEFDWIEFSASAEHDCHHVIFGKHFMLVPGYRPLMTPI